MTKIELDVINYNKELIDFDIACGFDLDEEYKEYFLENEVKYIQLAAKKTVFICKRYF